MNILKVSEERWQQAQKDELHYWSTQGPEGDDWNAWWQEQFEYYYFLKGHDAGPLIELGCGPFGGNAKRIVDLYDQFRYDVTLLDPLMSDFIKDGKSVNEFGDHHICSSIEDMSVVRGFEVVVCINVLDHVRDVAQCFQKMNEILYDGGMLILGQDLSNEIDYKNCPESWEDTKHPIKMDFESLAPFIFPYYQTKFLKILPRAQGRNPKAHYATLCWAGTKL